MKRKLLMLWLPLVCLHLSAQTSEGDPPPGTVSAKIYTHFNYSLDRDDPATAFEVKRAYFGYKRKLDDHFTAEVKLDIGSIDDDSEFALIRRYSYFKNAYLSYQTGNIIT